MARTAKAVSKHTKDGALDSAAALSAIDVANGLSITAAGQARGPLLLHVKNTFAGAKNVIVRAAPGQGQDLVVQVPATPGERFILLGDSSRYEQPGEVYNIDFEAAMTGTIAVYNLPLEAF
jgi:hypothetical protein